MPWLNMAEICMFVREGIEFVSAIKLCCNTVNKAPGTIRTAHVPERDDACGFNLLLVAAASVESKVQSSLVNKSMHAHEQLFIQSAHCFASRLEGGAVSEKGAGKRYS